MGFTFLRVDLSLELAYLSLFSGDFLNYMMKILIFYNFFNIYLYQTKSLYQYVTMIQTFLVYYKFFFIFVQT